MTGNKPQSKWLLVLVLIADIVNTFGTELTAAILSGDERGKAIATLVVYCFLAVIFYAIPVLIFCYCWFKEGGCKWNILGAVCYAILKPIAFYYGDNINTLLKMRGALVGCGETCQSRIEVSVAIALYIFIVVDKVDWSFNIKRETDWCDVVIEMLVELVSLDALYTAFISAANSKMLSTQTMFCRQKDQAFVFCALGITVVYCMYKMWRYYKKAGEVSANDTSGYKPSRLVIGLIGISTWFSFVVYLLADNRLPLGIAVCNTTAPDTANVEHALHIIKIVFSIVCFFPVVIITSYTAWYAFQKVKEQQTRRELEIS